MTRAGEREVVKAEHVNGGAGYILKEALIAGDQLGEHCKMFSQVTIPAGCELGHHEHHGETEVYHILSGEGLYQDNDKTYPVEAEMTTFCEDGNGHAISCKGDEPLVFLAMIQKKEA